VIRNLSGIWQLLFPEKYVKYLDLPRTSVPRWVWPLVPARARNAAAADLGRLTGAAITDADLWEAIRIHDAQRALLRELYDLRSEAPWKVPAVEMYRIQRAGFVLTGEAALALCCASICRRARRGSARAATTAGWCWQGALLRAAADRSPGHLRARGLFHRRRTTCSWDIASRTRAGAAARIRDDPIQA
jgi:benzoyl-CoA reductase subunit C